MTYECNGNNTHIAIIYGSQPCPLCASHSLIEELQQVVGVYVGSDECEYVDCAPDEVCDQDCRRCDAVRALRDGDVKTLEVGDA